MLRSYELSTLDRRTADTQIQYFQRRAIVVTNALAPQSEGPVFEPFGILTSVPNQIMG